MPVNVASAGWSTDGNWFSDGQRWNDAISADGKWRFDGANWVPFQGVRTPVPDPIPAPPPSAMLPAPVAAPVAAGAPMPSWVDPSEIDRLAREKAEREAHAAEPVAPLPPELDWRRVGEFMKYTPTKSTPFWRGGWTSAIVYFGLLWACSPLAIAYVWTTEWSIFTKAYRTVIASVWTMALFGYFMTHAPRGFG